MPEKYLCDWPLAVLLRMLPQFSVVAFEQVSVV
jgi:hypothetical protein